MNVINTLNEKLSHLDGVVFGYLFGSYAKNTQTEVSDVDVALFLKDTSFDNILQINYELSKALKKDVDLLVLNSAKNMYLLEDVLKEGIVLKDSEKRFDFEIMTHHNILDFKAFRKYIDAA